MRRIIAPAISLLLAVALAVGAVTAFTAATAPEAAAPAIASASPTAAPTATAQTSEEGAAPEVAESHAPRLVIDDVRRYAWQIEILTPPDFDHVFEVFDPAAGYSGTSDTLRLMLAHATSEANPRGPSPGNAWLPLAVGDTVTVQGALFIVTERWTAPKGAYAAQPPLTAETYERYTGAITLVTCVPLPPAADGSFRSATDNLWVILRPAL